MCRWLLLAALVLGATACGSDTLGAFAAACTAAWPEATGSRLPGRGAFFDPNQSSQMPHPASPSGASRAERRAIPDFVVPSTRGPSLFDAIVMRPTGRATPGTGRGRRRGRWNPRPTP